MRSHKWLRDLVNKQVKKQHYAGIDEFAQDIGISRATVYNLLRDPTIKDGKPVFQSPSTETLIKLAKALDLPTHELLYRLFPEAPGADSVPEMPPVERVKTYIAGWAGAGPGRFEQEFTRVLWLDRRLIGSRKVVGFFIRGDSMDGGKKPIKNGDLVLVDPTEAPTDGKAVVALLSEDRHVCKVFKNDRFGKRLYSRNADQTNGTPPSIDFSEVEQIIGTVCKVLSPTDYKPLLEEFEELD